MLAFALILANISALAASYTFLRKHREKFGALIAVILLGAFLVTSFLFATDYFSEAQFSILFINALSAIFLGIFILIRKDWHSALILIPAILWAIFWIVMIVGIAVSGGYHIQIG